MTLAPHDDLPAPRGSSSLMRLMALMIAGFTALVFAGAYIAGRSARPAGGVVLARPSAAAPARAAPAASTETAPVAEAAEAEPPVAYPPFDLRLLHESVAEDVRRAREVQARAREAAVRAREAADRARAGGAAGTAVITYESTGDSYAGEVRELDGARHGVGVYTWANPAELDYAGELADDAIGLGVKRWSDGATFFGDRRLASGHGVLTNPDGTSYEGAWGGGAPNGYGVMWNADGSVRAQGLWEAGTLVEAWIVDATVDPSAPPATAEPVAEESAAPAADGQPAQPDAAEASGGEDGQEADAP